MTSERPEILLIVAHPDDETVGAGALLIQNRRVQIVQVTDGAPRNMADATAAGFATAEEYASARIAETKAALQVAGCSPDILTNLGYTDQQVSFRLVDLTRDIVRTIERVAPEVLLTHAYEGGHPDHDSVAFAVHMAHRIYRQQNPRTSIRLMEFAGYNGFGGRSRMQEFIGFEGAGEQRHELSVAEQSIKAQMIRAFRTQRRTLEKFLPPRTEAYRDAPPYDFSRPPHEGKLHYENYDWGMDGVSWRRLASEAMRELKVTPGTETP